MNERIAKWENVLTKGFLTQRYLVEKASGRQIAMEVGCHRHTVYRYLRRRHIPRRKSGRESLGYVPTAVQLPPSIRADLLSMAAIEEEGLSTVIRRLVQQAIRKDKMKGQFEVFNFDTQGAAFDCDVVLKAKISSLTFTRERPGKPVDTVLLWVKTEDLDKIREKLPERETNEKTA